MSNAARIAATTSIAILLAAMAATSFAERLPNLPQVAVTTKSVPVITFDNLRFRDLDRDGKLSPFEDWRLSPASRAKDLLARLSLEEKAGLLLHGTAPAQASAAVGRGTEYDAEKAKQLIVGKHVVTLITRLSVAPSAFAEQNNALQEIAEENRYGIPLTISTDPRNVFEATVGASSDSGGFTKWPGTLGLAAIDDPATTKLFGDETRREYLAVGLHEALSPQADLATEPRWPRIDGTFGEDAQLAKRMVEAYIEGFQDGEDGLHSGSIACVVKHWVGYGAAKDGWDSHNAYGKHATFPGKNLPYHEIPFEGAFAAHVAGVMPTYSILDNATIDGKPVEAVGAGMNRELLTDLLRDRFHYKGLIVSDWLITSDCVDRCVDGAPSGTPPSIVPGKNGMSWGTEDLTVSERYLKALNAGIDQFGGVSDSDIIVSLVQSGKVSMARIDASAQRVLEQKFSQGLFEHPFVDEAAANKVVGNAQFAEDSLAAQHRSQVLLRNEGNVLPLRTRNLRVALYGFSEDAARRHSLEPVALIDKPDYALVRLHAPHQNLHPGYFFGSRQHEGDLDFKANDPQFAAFQQLSAKVPTIVSIYLDRPAVLKQLQNAKGILADFGATDDAILDVITGRASPEGKLPFELPSSMDAVHAQLSDVPHDSKQPLYPIFFGLRYKQ